MDVLQLGYEIEVLQQNDLNEDEKLDRMIRCLDAVVMTGIQKSINKFVTEYVPANTQNPHEALLILDKVESILKQHEDHFVAIFEEFFIDLHLFDYVADSILQSISSMVKHLLHKDDDPASVQALVQSYRKICNILYTNCTEKEKADVEWIESDTLEIFISAEINRLSNQYTLGLIENVLENTRWDVDMTDAAIHFDAQNNFFFTHSVLDTFNIINPIITNLMALPLNQAQIMQIIQLFSSFISHFAIALHEKIITYLEEHRASSNVLFLMIGDLNALKKQTQKYLDSQQFIERFENATRSKQQTKQEQPTNCQTILMLVDHMLRDIETKTA
eukprot:746266_1